MNIFQLFWQNWTVQYYFLYLQSASEKHKINVPETMNEFLDMSDDEGKWKMLKLIFIFLIFSH